jgi:hypothetical protein
LKLLWSLADLVLLLAILLDVLSLAMACRKVIRGHGPSGIPGLSWLIYVGWINLEQFHRDHPSGWPLQAFLLATVFHMMCQFGVPAVYSRWFSRRD